jgi:hypothetical protein
MAISRLAQPIGASVQPVGALGTYTLAVPLTPGLYKITTDTTQNLSAAQLYFQTSEGFRFGAVIRGGQGYVAIPQTVTTVTFTAGTFPLLIGFERFTSYSLAAAPAVSLAWDPVLANNLSGNGTAVLTHSLTTSSVIIYRYDGTTQTFTNPASPLSLTMPTASRTLGQSRSFLVAVMDANGVYGLGTAVSTGNFPYAIYTASGTFTVPAGVTSADMVVVGGGASGGSSKGNQVGGGFGERGGGGAQVRHELNRAVTPGSTLTITIGNGGTPNNAANWGTTVGNPGTATSVTGFFTASPGLANGTSGSGRTASSSGGAGHGANATNTNGGAGLTVLGSGWGGGGGGGVGGGGAGGVGVDGGGNAAGAGSISAGASGVRGGGGGGGWSNNAYSQGTGGSGGAGLVVIIPR